MTETAEIICKDAIIEFPIFDKGAQSIKSQASKPRHKLRSFRALDHISLSIHQGERVGLLGQNGAGKSTFLRALAGVYAPQSGQITVNGTITSIFDLAVGTDVDASGYDNIPLLMALRRIPFSQTAKVIADVEEFTELGEALQRSLRTYSAGMRLRIVFAVATFKTEEILLMDEVAGVGDRQFAAKSKSRIAALMGQAGTLVLASHSDELLKHHCDRGIYFRKGKIEFDGPIEDAIKFSKSV